MCDDIKSLVDAAATIKKQQDELKQQQDEVAVKLAEHAERILSDKGVKSTVFYGTNGNSVVITSPVKTTVVSYHKLVEAIGEQMLNEYAPEIQQHVVREPNKEFLQMCADIVLDNYHDEDLESFLKKTFKADDKQVGVLKKKLKGSYTADVKTLSNMFGEKDYDVEFFYIQRILNFRRMKLFLPGDMGKAIEAVRDAVAVDEGLSTKISMGRDCL